MATNIIVVKERVIMFDYDEEAKRAVPILDRYDLSRYLDYKYRRNIYDVIDSIDMSDKEFAEAFDCLSLDEFVEYLHDRYGVQSYEITTIEIGGMRYNRRR